MPRHAHTVLAWGLAVCALTVATTTYLCVGPVRLSPMSLVVAPALVGGISLATGALSAVIFWRRRHRWFARPKAWRWAAVRTTIAAAIGLSFGFALAEWLYASANFRFDALSWAAFLGSGAIAASTVFARVIGRAQSRDAGIEDA